MFDVGLKIRKLKEEAIAKEDIVASQISRRGLLGGVPPLVIVSAVTNSHDPEPVDLELILAADISRSMDPEDLRVQFEGYAAAFNDADVQKAIGSGALGSIAVSLFVWAEADFQKPLVGWRKLSNKKDCDGFAGVIKNPSLQTGTLTSISGAINYAMLQWGNGYEGTRRVIDISGDGTNDIGPSLEEARIRALSDGVVINGLPIILPNPPTGTKNVWTNPVDIEQYYKENVIIGPGAFVEVARGLEDFPLAIRRKLIREIAGPPLSSSYA